MAHASVPPPPATAGGYRNPTSTVGQRVGAWLIELLIILAVTAALFFAFSDSVAVGSDFEAEVVCELVNNDFEALVDGFGVEVEQDSFCLPAGSNVYILSDAALILGVMLPHVALWFIFAIIQGIGGASPGKLIFGIRVVNDDGSTIGIGKSLGRTAMMIVDGFPWGIPMALGLLLAATSDKHQRLGDRVVNSYVVRKGDVGQPVVATVGVVGAGAYGQPAPPQPPGWGQPSAAAPGFGGGAPASPGPPVFGAPPPSAPAAGPEWDSVLGRWVHVAPDGSRQSWDDALGVWRPVD